MGKRYFYTDPLKAAWMLREHNICYGYSSRWNLDGDPLDSNKVDNYKFFLDNFFSRKTRFYIHSASYDALKPQVGDLVKWTINHGNHDKEVIVKEVMQEGQLDIKWINHLFEDKSLSTTYLPHIIQRNGKAWFTPEEEDDV